MLKNIKTIAMMGKPGSGKGTQARRLSESLDFYLFSSGDSFRALSKQESPLGRRVKNVIDNGLLMPHWFASYMFEKEVFNATSEQGIVFEGPGRKLPEAQLFHEIMDWLERPYIAIYLKVDEDVIRERLSVRAGEEGRADDNTRAIEHRFEEYNKHTAHSVDFFREQGLLIEVDGMMDPDVVEHTLIKELKKLDEALSKK
jgi:adenylate kinase